MKNSQNGQTLVMLLVFVIIAITITSTAAIVVAINALGSQKMHQSLNAFYAAESGAENALLRLLRDPNYSGETLTVGDGLTTITVTGSSTKTINVTGTNGNFQRKIQVVASYVNNVLTVVSWKEVF